MNEVQGRGRKQLLLLVAFFSAPIILAIIVYNYTMEHGVGETKNHGDLVVPARPLTDVELTDSENKPFKFSDMKKTWIMVYIGSNTCNEECKKAIYLIRQTRLAQQGEHKRIMRLYISTNGQPDQAFKELLKEHPGLQVVSGNDKAIANIIDQFALEGKSSASDAGRIYLVDPLGNLMMSYEKGFDPKGLIKDLTVLLKISRIG